MDVVTLTQELIRHNSVSSESNLAISEYLARRLNALGMSVTIQEFTDGAGIVKQNVIGRIPAIDGRTRGGLLFAGHMDTVPFEKGEKADLAPSMERGRLFGRGACDMKGGIAAELAAIERFEGVPLKHPLTVAFTCDEEVGMLGARKLRDSGQVEARRAIVAEPTELVPIRMHKGNCVGRVNVHGRASHSSDPRRGVNALKAAVKILTALEEIEWTYSQVPPTDGAERFDPAYATLNVGMLTAGRAVNVVPGECAFTLEVRFLPGQDPKAILKELDDTCRSVAKKFGARAQFEIDHLMSAMVTPAEEALVHYLELITARPAGAVSYTTEGHIYNAMGMHTVILGPGSVHQAHRRDEYVPTNELHKAVDIYAAAIQRFCA